MIANLTARLRSTREAGQSITETALFLPILILLIAGAAEVSNLLITQNRVTTAARVATGFGAVNYVGEDWNDPYRWAPNMANVAFNNVTNTLDLSPELWDIWTVHATLNAEGSAFASWNDVHAHDGDVVTPEEWDLMETQIMTDVLDALDPSEFGLEIVVTVAFHNRRSLLGLNAFNIGALNPVRGLSVMRVDNPPPYTACNAFPIAVSAENYALYPSDSEVNEPFENFPFDGSNPSNQTYWRDKDPPESAPAPVYTQLDSTQFPLNVPGVHLTEAPANGGYIYLSKQATENGPGNFGWLQWVFAPGHGGSPTLATSLHYPGDSHTYYFPDYHQDGLGLYDLVDVRTGGVNSNAVRTEMEEHVDTVGRTLKLIVFTPPIEQFRFGDWNGNGEGTKQDGGTFDHVEVYGFAVVRVLAWELVSNANWMLFEFVRWDNSC